MSSLSLIVSGPSGCGKSTLLNALFNRFNDKFAFVISHTTREPRSGELNGREYFFVNKNEFDQMIKEDRLIEWVKFAHNYYGTSFDAVNHVKSSGKIPVFDVDLNGVKTLKKLENFPAKYLLILPPSIESLFKQLNQRQTESNEQINERVSQAKIDLIKLQTEKHLFDHVIINDDLNQSKQEIISFVQNNLNLK